jgi:lipopolysaccharide export system permease protein
LLALNELWAPNSSQRADSILERHATKSGPAGGAGDKEKQASLGFRNVRARRAWVIGLYDFKTAVMTHPTVDWIAENGSRYRIVAARADWVNQVWTFQDAQEFETKAATGTNGTSFTSPILRTNLLAMPQFNETPADFGREARFASRLSLRRAHSAELPIFDLVDYLRLHPDLSPRDKWWLETQLQGRLAAPWTCLVVVLIAIPFGAPSGRRNIFVGVAGSIGICFAYFIVLRLGLALGTGGYLPAGIAAWLPNVSFGAAGLWLARRVR